MATAILNMKKATKTAKVKNETLLRTKTMQRAAILLKQVSDPTRLQVVTLLSEGERHVGGLCDQVNMSQPAVSHHLAQLWHGGIVDSRRQDNNNFYSLTDTGYRLSKIAKALRERIDHARVVMEKGSLRQMTEALRSVIDKIECSFSPKGKRHSSLEKVTIIPLVGDPVVLNATAVKLFTANSH